MTQPDTRLALARVLATQSHSLANYIASTTHWTPGGSENAQRVLRHIVDDKNLMAARLIDHILDVHGEVDSGEFPMEFTSLHDLSLSYLMRQLLAAQKHDIATLERSVAELRSDPIGQDLAAETLGEAKGHLDALAELAAAGRKA